MIAMLTIENNMIDLNSIPFLIRFVIAVAAVVAISFFAPPTVVNGAFIVLVILAVLTN